MKRVCCVGLQVQCLLSITVCCVIAMCVPGLRTLAFIFSDDRGESGSVVIGKVVARAKTAPLEFAPMTAFWSPELLTTFEIRFR